MYLVHVQSPFRKKTTPGLFFFFWEPLGSLLFWVSILFILFHVPCLSFLWVSLQCPCCWWDFSCSSCSSHSYIPLDWPSLHDSFHVCTSKQCAGSNEGLGASLLGLGVWSCTWFPPFSDCSLCFTHIMGTLSCGSTVTMFLFVSWGALVPCVHHSLPSFYHGKTAPGGGCSSRGPLKSVIFVPHSLVSRGRFVSSKSLTNCIVTWRTCTK